MKTEAETGAMLPTAQDTRSEQRLKEAGGASPETSEDVWPCPNLDFELLASRL